MPRFAALLVVFLVVGAGCAGIPQAPGTSTPQPPGPAEPTPTDSKPPDDTSQETTAAPPALNGTLAPGVTNEGIQNTSKLLDAHASALQARGFDLGIDRHFPNNTHPRRLESQLTAAPDLRVYRQHATQTVGNDQTVQRTWLNATMERMLVRVDAGDETAYRIPPVGPADSPARVYRLEQLIQKRQLAELLRGGEFEVLSVNASGETSRYTLAGTNFSTDGAFGEREVYMIVDRDGVLHVVTAEGTFANGDPFTFAYHLHQLDIDTVDRPAWVAAAPTPLDTQPTIGFENCTTPYLTIDNPGPDTVPTGTDITVRLNETKYTVSLDAPLEPGEQRALYLTAAGTLNITATDAVPANRTPMPNEASFTIATTDGMLLASGGIGFGCEQASEEAGSGSA